MANPINDVMEKVKTWARVNSPWAIHFNSGSCNGCDIEILATLTPRYDVERFGIKLQGSPRHADVLICTGPVSLQAKDRLLRIYEQMPEPKFVVAVGSCGISGGVLWFLRTTNRRDRPLLRILRLETAHCPTWRAFRDILSNRGNCQACH